MKHKTKDGTYTVYDAQTDEFIMIGTVKQICNKLDITKSTVSKAVKNDSIVRRRYKIYYEDEE